MQYTIVGMHVQDLGKGVGKKWRFWPAGWEPNGREGTVDHLDYHIGQDPLYPEPLNRDELRI